MDSSLDEEDHVLVTRASRGDQAAFAALYRRYRGIVHAIALSRMAPQDASDTVQEVFARALSKLKTLRKPASFRSWIGMIARNQAMDFHRKRKPATNAVDEIAVHSPPHTEAARILSVIQTLPDAYRETLIMRFVEGMTGPEIANRTGLKPESVRVNLHRGMKILRAKLGLEDGDA